MSASTHPNSTWTTERIRELGMKAFSKRLCYSQIEIIKQLSCKKDVIACLPTGAGKTLTFWMPLLMALEEGKKDSLTFVVTPLNILGKQNEEQLNSAGLRAISVTGKNASKETFKAIENGKYNVVIINPEILMSSPHLDTLWKKPSFTSRIVNFVFDEGHCISQWGSFRKEYKTVVQLRHLIPHSIPFYIASATLPTDVRSDIKSILQLRPEDTAYISRSNDRPDISLKVRSLSYPASSYKDLDFLLDLAKDWKPGDELPDKFLVFFDNLKEAEAACRHFSARLPEGHPLKDTLFYFHSTLTAGQRERYVKAMQSGKGMDIPDIKIAVQWKATCDLCTLWQRFGRVARGEGVIGIAILLVEKKDTEEERQQKALRALEKTKKAKEKQLTKSTEQHTTAAGSKRKATDQLSQAPKRPALGDRTTATVNRSTELISASDVHVPTSTSTPSTHVEPAADIENRRR
ncbi:P-loop containing nucleoside triphosphate hydrolase protein [Coprinopsis sp. MPI-PUGE-AT-0042]|nr:P-loop containing nucleoside triphosphate hydrolase protein [Coprinopsis sp. MPI-PUGE-AT-0042]